MTKTDELSAFCKKPFSEAVAKFEDLLVQNDRAFLIGSGCSKCAGLPLTAELTTQALTSAELDNTSKAILKAIEDLFGGTGGAHIEDYLSELIDLLAIAERRGERGATQCEIALDGKSYTAEQLLDATKRIKPTFPISAPEKPSSRLRVVNDQNLSTFQPRNKRFPSYFG